MQLTPRAAIIAVLVAAAVLVVAAPARAQVLELDTTHSVFYEAPTKTHMFVYSPTADVRYHQKDAVQTTNPQIEHE